MSAEPSKSPPDAAPDESLVTSLSRLVKLAAILFALIMVGVGIAAYMGPESRDLPVEYDGFD